MNEIVSEKINLTPMNKTDWAAYVAHVTEAEELYKQYGIEPSKNLIECIQKPTPNVIYYSVISKDLNTMVGYIGITPANNNIEFYIFKEYRRQGYGYEAVSSFTRVYLNGTISGKTEENVIAETLSDNSASIALLEKLGYQKRATGIRVNFDESNGSVIGLAKYAFPGGDEQK